MSMKLTEILTKNIAKKIIYKCSLCFVNLLMFLNVLLLLI